MLYICNNKNKDMTKGQLRSGEKMFKVRVEHFVKLGDFAKALTDHYYLNGDSFSQNLTMKEGEEILRRQLFFNGLRGEFDDNQFEASNEDCENYNAIYENAKIWVKSKYPYFS